MTDIQKWLEDLGLSRYSAIFVENDIDMEIIAELSEQDLASMDVSLGHRKKILKAIGQLAAVPSAAAPAFDPPDQSASPSLLVDPERRHLSLMFCDLAESTHLASIIDLEDMHDINRAFQDACAAAIEQFDGFVARYMGDGILAYFGYPVAHEDDAERAVRSGLEITTSVGSLGKSLNLPGGIQLSVRVGIATGPVVVEVIGEGASQESAVVGEAPNRAARLQGLAEANSVVIDLSTRQLLADRFELSEAGEHSLKGVAEAVKVWQVQGERSIEKRMQSTRSSTQLPMVGRDEELGLLLSRWEQTKLGEGQVVLLSGESGIGKSRISQALMEATQQDNHTLMRFFCSSYHTKSPLHPFVGHIELQCGFRPNEPNVDKQLKLERLLLDKYRYSREALSVIASLLSVELDQTYHSRERDPVSQLSLLQDSVIENIVSHSRKGPVMFILEDVQWIDPTSKNCLDLLVGQAQNSSILVLFSARPTDSFNYNYTHVTQLSINKLSKRHVAHMITGLAKNSGMNEAVMEIIGEKSDGIPLFVEEVTKMMVEARLNDASSHSTKNIELGVPDSLQASLLSRLDRLGDVKRIAQTASVVGDTFDLGMLANLCNRSENEIQLLLDVLLKNETIYQHKTPSGLRYRFRHALLRDAAYESLLKRNRTRLHGEVARYLIENIGTLTGKDDEIIAYHYSEAGDTQNAYRHWLSAGINALDSGATYEAVDLLDNAKNYMPADSSDVDDLNSMYLLQMAHGKALNASFGATSRTAHDSFSEAVRISQTLNNILQQIDSLDHQFGIIFNAGMLRESLKPAQKMLKIGIENDHLIAMVSGYQALGMAYFTLGQFDKAGFNLESALDTKGHEITGINCYPSMTMDYLSYVLFITGDSDAARKMCDNAYLSALKESDYSTASALSNGSVAQMILGNIDIVRGNAADLIVLAEEKGQHMYLNRGLLFKNLSQAIIERDETCLQHVVDAIQQLLESGEEIDATCLLGFTAETQISFEQFDQAGASLAQALGIANKNDERYYQSELHRLKAELAMTQRGTDWQATAANQLNKARTLAQSQNAGGWLTKIAVSEQGFLETKNKLKCQ